MERVGYTWSQLRLLLKALKQVGEKVLVENMPESARKKTRKVQRSLEKTLLYPLLRGKVVDRWIAAPELLILFPHKGDDAIGEKELKKFHGIWAYLDGVRDFLSSRKMYDLGFRKLEFYALFETGTFLVADWKVVFREQAASLTAAVVGPLSNGLFDNKPVIPDHKLMVTAMDSPEEAYYVCAVLNSSPSRLFAESYSIETSISTHIFDYIKIPRFNARYSLHSLISKASKKAHELKAGRNEKELSVVEQRIDEAAAESSGGLRLKS